MKRYIGVLMLLFLPMIAHAQGTKPEPRSGHDLVWDDKLGMVLLVNGDYTQSDRPGKIWGWDGETWQVVSDDAPPIMTLGGVAYDSAQDTLVLNGGSQRIDPDR